MLDIEHIFTALGGTSAVARILSVGQSTASEMRRRRSIQVKYWRPLVAAAEERCAGEGDPTRRAALEAITYEGLVAAHAPEAAE